MATGLQLFACPHVRLNIVRQVVTVPVGGSTDSGEGCNYPPLACRSSLPVPLSAPLFPGQLCSPPARIAAGANCPLKLSPAALTVLPSPSLLSVCASVREPIHHAETQTYNRLPLVDFFFAHGKEFYGGGLFQPSHWSNLSISAGSRNNTGFYFFFKKGLARNKSGLIFFVSEGRLMPEG